MAHFNSHHYHVSTIHRLRRRSQLPRDIRSTLHLSSIQSTFRYCGPDLYNHLLKPPVTGHMYPLIYATRRDKHSRNFHLELSMEQSSLTVASLAWLPPPSGVQPGPRNPIILIGLFPTQDMVFNISPIMKSIPKQPRSEYDERVVVTMVRPCKPRETMTDLPILEPIALQCSNFDQFVEYAGACCGNEKAISRGHNLHLPVLPQP